jgi:hypothetical protein
LALSLAYSVRGQSPILAAGLWQQNLNPGVIAGDLFAFDLAFRQFQRWPNTLLAHVHMTVPHKRRVALDIPSY